MNMIDEQRPTVLRASRVRPIQPDTYDDLDADVKPHSSALRVSRQTEPITQPPVNRYRITGVWCKGLLILVIALGIFLVGDTAGYAAWITISNHLRYGDYPTAQMNVNLGHNGISHLTAYTVGNEIVLTEQVGNKLTPYAIKVGTKLEPPRVVSIMIADVNLDKKPDVLLHVDGLTQSIIFDNTGTGLSLALAK